MGPKSKTPISSPAAAAEGSAKKRAKGSSANVQLLYTNCESGGAVFSNVYKDYFSSTVIAEKKRGPIIYLSLRSNTGLAPQSRFGRFRFIFAISSCFRKLIILLFF